MKRLWQKEGMKKTEKGVASIYVVIFATILFGVITVSFARIILSEAEQSSNDDLSRSAYDSALAGVEDAKVAVNRYYSCVAENDVSACRGLNVFSKEDEDCTNGFPLGEVVYNTRGEVKIQETRGSANDNGSEQAYTCVIIRDVTPDYRAKLTSDTRTKVVPLAVTGAATQSSETIKGVTQIKFSWYSNMDRGSDNTNANIRLNNDGKLHNVSGATTPPTVQLTFLKTGPQIYKGNFDSADNQGDVVYSTMIFMPTDKNSDFFKNDTRISHNRISEDEIKDIMSATEIRNAGNATKSDGNGSISNAPYPVSCTDAGSEFLCSVFLQVGDIVKDAGNVFLIASLPYGDARTDFAVTMLDNNGHSIDFRGVQISVDSTGRTNTLFRRVESRLDPADLFFPYPQYELQLTGDSNTTTSKNFWVTNNCWKSGPDTDGTWKAETCVNNRER